LTQRLWDLFANMTGTVFSASLSLVLCALFALSGEAAITGERLAGLPQ
jgi:hypothetical protein